MKLINMFYGHTAELLNVKACGTINEHCALNG